MLSQILEFFFRVPTHDIRLPLPARLIPHARETISEALRITYFQGISKGFIYGVVLTMLFLPSLRGKPRKGGN